MRYAETIIAILFCSTVLAQPPVRLVPVEEEIELNRMLPIVDYDSSPQVWKILNSHELIWYTDREMPPAYQLQNAFHSPFYNVSNQNERDLSGRLIGKDRIGNGNRDFPWVTTAGTDASSDVEIFRFCKFPKDENGKFRPMVYFTGPNPGSNLRNPNNRQNVLGEGGGNASSQRWVYPVGMVFGELMCMQGPDDLLYPFELRLRFREREYWEVDVLRPFPSAPNLETKIKDLRTDWWQNDNLIKFVSALKNPKIEEDSIRDRNRDIVAFSSRFKKHVLPPISDNKLIAELLTTANWKSAHGVEWVPGVTAPTAPKGSKFHIVPEEYSGHIVPVDSKSCANCHLHTGHNVRTFDQNRGWYGRVRGNDRIFTFHPIDPGSISYDGNNRPIVFRPDLVKAGLVESYDARKHSGSLYKILP